MTVTFTHTTAGDYTIDLVNGFPVEVCARCGGRDTCPATSSLTTPAAGAAWEPSTPTRSRPARPSSASRSAAAAARSSPSRVSTRSGHGRWDGNDRRSTPRLPGGALVVIRARAWMSSGSDSVNTFRSHSGTRQRHFRLCHNNTGRSGPIRTSRGRVVTRSFGDEDCCRHAGHHPPTRGRSSSAPPAGPRRRSAPDRRSIRRSPTAANYPWSMARGPSV